MKRYHGLRIYKTMLRILDGKKIIGRASKDELEALCKKVAKPISAVDSKRTESQIYDELRKRFKIVYTETLPRFSGSAGLNLFNTIYVDKVDVDKITNNEHEDLLDETAYEYVVHECIHKLQKDKINYRGKEARGFLEGATDLYAMRATYKNRSCSTKGGDVSFNFHPTAYINPVCIMAQLEVIFGKEMVENYALKNDQTLLDNLREMIGKDKFDGLRKDLNRSINANDPQLPYKYWQNELLDCFAERELGKINTKEDAEEFLNQLKKLDAVRRREKGDESLKRFYNKKLEYFKDKFPDFDIEKNKYEEAEFYPEIYFDEEIKEMDTLVLRDFQYVENLEEFQNIKLEEYNRYRLVKDKKIYEIITQNGEVKKFNYIDEKINTKSVYIGKEMKHIDKSLEDSNFSAKIDENGKVILSIGEPFSEEIINQEMEQVPLNITKEDIYNQMLEREEFDIKFASLGEKIARIFKRQKKLPPYKEVEEPNSKNVGKKPSWELTTEEQEDINKKALEEVRRIKDTQNNEENLNNDSIDQDEIGNY